MKQQQASLSSLATNQEIDPALNLAGTLLSWVYDDIDGHALSAEDGQGQWTGFSYGEICFGSFSELLDLLAPGPGATFWDLGSGTGKAVLAAALSKHRFARCSGVELVVALHEAACGAREQLPLWAARISDPHLAQVVEEMAPVEFIHGDIAGTDIFWEVDADVVFSNNTRFLDDLLMRIVEKATRMKLGARLITTRVLPNCEGILELSEVINNMKMTYGRTTVLVYKRVSRSSNSSARKYWYGYGGLVYDPSGNGAVECLDEMD